MTASTMPVPNNRIPGPRVMPLIGWRGNYYRFMNDQTGYVWALYKQYGTLCCLQQFEEHEEGTLWAFGAPEIKQVLSNPTLFPNTSISVSAPEGSAHYWLGRGGLFNLNGESHKQERRLMMPAFHKKHLETYYEDMVTLTNKHLATWKLGESYNLFNEMYRLTQDISIRALFEMDTPDDVQTIQDTFNEWLRLSRISEFIPFDHPWLPYGKLMQVSQRLYDKMVAVIETKRKSGGDSTDMLSLLIYGQREDGSKLSDNEIVSELNLFWNTNETTAAALVWTFFLLMQHPAVMAALMDEFDTHLHGNPPTVEQVYQLPLLGRVIKESMRCLPSGNFLTTRNSTEPFELGPYHLAKGTRIAISPFVTHHISEYYDQPHAFVPDRWLTINPSPYEYIPFGAGTRYCIGATLASFEMHVLIPMILQQFCLSMKPNLRVDRYEQPMLRPKNGLPVTINPQNRQFTKTPVRGNIHELVTL